MARNTTILVVDDEVQIQRLLKLGLGAAGFRVLSARNLADAFRCLSTEEVDLVLLEIGLPDRGGFEALEEIRKVSHAPVIVLSEREGEIDKVRAFELGADDYVTKPFGMAELIARLRVAMKHRYQTEGVQPVLRLGDLEIDLVNGRVSRGDAEIDLTKMEYEILSVLAKYAGKVLTHDFILRNVRGAEYPGGAQYLRVYVRSLRNKLGDISDRKVIRTETGVGYRLVASIPDKADAARR
jgi:two-component system, OmpR family, KDP operon response regulator KdpE